MSDRSSGIRPDDEFRRLAHREEFRGRVVGISVDDVVLPGGARLEHELIHLPSAVGIVPVLGQERCRLGRTPSLRAPLGDDRSPQDDEYEAALQELSDA